LGVALKILSLSGAIGAISALLCRAAVEAIELGTEQITNASLERCWYITVLEPRTSRRPRRSHRRLAASTSALVRSR
jgi:hypothetical protein